MISDRGYMREPEWRGGWPLTVWLIVANVAVFILQVLMDRFARAFHFDEYFALSLFGIQHGYLWQLVTFQFLHGGPLHLLLNCWALYVFGRDLEEFLGRAAFLKLYLFSGVLGGVLQLLCAWIAPDYFGGLLVGASAGVFGLIAAYAALFPERQFTVLLFFILPVSLRAKMLLFWGAVLAVIGMLMRADNVAHAAHLGGMLGGLAYLNFTGQPSLVGDGLGALWDRLRSRFSGRPSPPVSRRNGRWERLEWDEPPPERPVRSPRPDQFMAEEVDPILDKIAAHGIHSLTDREREILEKARARMAKR
ncbi:MAG: rhomboid family intramembrane serine protease [Verrucomicrobiae bacterium]|nr:rhomboid family intramembrane serine protease [Verrucomicrobiae bacterium]